MRTSSWIKSLGGGLVILIGGPALIRYVQPTEEELFKRYNPDLQRRSLEGREERLKEANEFIDRLKEYSKSDKPIWTVWKEEALAEKKRKMAAELATKDQKKSIAEELRR